MNTIRYRSLKKYKYQLYNTYSIKTNIKWYKTSLPFLTLYKNGMLVIKRGYAWDGPSGPTIDTKNFMRGSLIHDAFYQLMRMGVILQFEKDRIDKLLQAHCIEDGMSKIRAWWVYWGVRVGGNSAAKIQPQPKIYTAP